jgi:ferrous iron transport protein A
MTRKETMDMPLAMVGSGSRVTVTSVNGGRAMRQWLADIGLTSGVKISVLVNQLAGPMMINLKDSRFAIGRGMVQRIMVRED